MKEIALIEDNLNDAELTELALRRSAMDVSIHHFRDGADALKALVEEAGGLAHAFFGLQMIFLDLKLPKLNGFQVLERLRSNSEFRTIPIVVLTSSAVESDIRLAYELGANSYIVKPIDFQKHSETIVKATQYWTEINTLP